MPPKKRSREPPAIMVELSGGYAQHPKTIDKWRSETLCDFEVLVDGRIFKAHKTVLTTGSVLRRTARWVRSGHVPDERPTCAARACRAIV